MTIFTIIGLIALGIFVLNLVFAFSTKGDKKAKTDEEKQKEFLEKREEFLKEKEPELKKLAEAISTAGTSLEKLKAQKNHAEFLYDIRRGENIIRLEKYPDWRDSRYCHIEEKRDRVIGDYDKRIESETKRLRLLGEIKEFMKKENKSLEELLSLMSEANSGGFVEMYDLLKTYLTKIEE